MINGKRVLAYIPIRSGSKSIIDKNIVDVEGKPLVAYSILAAKESKYVDEVIVSTDSANYAEIVKQFGAKAPFLRPDELASDTAVEMDACQHMMAWVEENWQEKFDIILKLEATSPLRLADDIDRAIEKLVEKNADTVITVTEALTPPFWMNTLNEEKSMKDFIAKDVARKNRQELPMYYQLDGVVFAARWDFVKLHKTWFTDNSFASITPSDRAIDVDGPIQLDLVRVLIRKRNERKAKLSSSQEVKQVAHGTSGSVASGSAVEDLFSVKGKVAIVTGAVGLIGSQYVEILSNAGAHVVIADIDQVKCDAFARQITESSGVEALGVEVDISNEASVAAMARKIVEKFGKIDILINNAAGRPKAYFEPFENYPGDDWDFVTSVNLRGTFLCSKVVGNYMLKSSGKGNGEGKGVIVNIGSTYGVVGNDMSIYEGSEARAFPSAVYAATKGGVINLTRHLATYWGRKGIRVNCLSPGGVLTNQSEGFVARYSARTPIGRMANKDEYKGAILFLCSDASSYMTGANLVVDGGWTAW